MSHPCFVCGSHAVTNFIDGMNGETIYLCELDAEVLSGATNEMVDMNLLESLDLEVGEF
jgi:hypothetical protein